MPHIEYLLGDIVQIIRLNGRDISNKDLKNIDGILCRSVTQVDESLLKNTKVRFVGTATIGTDHLDIDWLEKNQIQWSNASGCNAAAVAQYVISGIAFWFKLHKNHLKKQFNQLSVGIVGAGHVGSQLANYLELLGIKYYLCDPPLKKRGDKRHLVSLDKVLDCDVISLHVPLTLEGEDKTFHLINENILNRLSKKQLLINSARGAVIDNRILLDYLKSSHCASVILDVFENEPNICSELVAYCLLATPHIAGHTLEGKSRGSYMVYKAFCHYFNLRIKHSEAELYPPKNVFQEFSLDDSDTLLKLYDIHVDSQGLVLAIKEKIKQGSSSDIVELVEKISIGKYFDYLRKTYQSKKINQPRRDYSGWQLNTSDGIHSNLMIEKLFSK